MLLAIDAGNTQTHIGMYKNDELAEHWRLHTDRDVTVDRIATELAGLLGLRGLRLSDIDGAIVSSVVPVLSHEYELLSERYLEGQLLMVGPRLKTGMPIRMDNPHEVGADRLVNALAAYERIGTTCIAVDFGTAVNYDVVSSEGEYLGGVLAPGVEVSLDALAERAARLFKVDLESPLVYGFAGQVDGILGRIREELGEEATAVATGGHAAIIAPHCDLIDEVDDLLTLTGLRLIWERNRPPA
jgi:type III pantothenate kinase